MIKIDLNPPESQLRQFGGFALIGFPLATLGISRIADLEPLPAVYYALAFGVLCLIVGQVRPTLLKPVFIALITITLPIGFVISWTLMVLIYFGLVTPVGLVFRLLGKDPLDKHPDPKARSYWRVRTKPRTAASYFAMY